MTTTPAVRICVACGERPARSDRRTCTRCSSPYTPSPRSIIHAGESTLPCPYCETPYNVHAHCAACGVVVGPAPHALQQDQGVPDLCARCAQVRRDRGEL